MFAQFWIRNVVQRNFGRRNFDLDPVKEDYVQPLLHRVEKVPLQRLPIQCVADIRTHGAVALTFGPMIAIFCCTGQTTQYNCQ